VQAGPVVGRPPVIDRAGAEKCRQIIAIGHPGLVFVPIVIDRDNAPSLVDASPPVRSAS
jgi:hypothetical protein